MTKKERISNREIADILSDIGQMLELQGENRFKVIAYENAANTVRTYPQDLTTIFKEDGIRGLDAIPGIGERIAAKLGVLIKTGELPYYERLKNEIPELELMLVQINGIGPQKAKKIIEMLNPKSMTDLLRKLHTKEAKEFFSDRTIENIFYAIKERRHTERLLSSDVEPVVEKIISFLCTLPEVVEVDAAGSLRRRKETVGDIDLVAASKNTSATVTALGKAPFVGRVITSGTNQTTILHKSGFQVDLKVVPPAEYGSLLQHFTGSKEHNVALRTLAEKNGMSLSENGITNIKTNKLKKFSTEEAFYRALKMDWIPPELRENQGEIEASIKHRLPKLIEEKDIQANLHIHTTDSDGQLSLVDMVKAAFEYGYAYICITNHAYGAGKGLSAENLAKHRDEIRRIDQIYTKKGMRVFAGVEVNIRPNGEIAVCDDLLKTFDYVVASVHSDYRLPIDTMTRRILKTIQNPNVDLYWTSIRSSNNAQRRNFC